MKKSSLLFVVVLVSVVSQVSSAQQFPGTQKTIWIQGIRKMYPLLPSFGINKSEERMQLEAARGRFRLERMESAPPRKLDLFSTMTPVKDQAYRGSCVAFASTAMVEMQIKAKTGKDVDLSEQFIYWASKALPGGTAQNSEGSMPLDMLNTYARYGTTHESMWPYEPKAWYQDKVNHMDCYSAYKSNPENIPTECVTNGDPTPTARQAPRISVTNQQEVETSPEAIISWLARGIPVEIGVEVFDGAWGFKSKSSPAFLMGAVDMPNVSEKPAGGHAVLLVGYDMDAKLYYFKNSWGTDEWGAKSKVPGTGTIPMEYLRKYGVAAVARIKQ